MFAHLNSLTLFLSNLATTSELLIIDKLQRNMYAEAVTVFVTRYTMIVRVNLRNAR